MAIINTLHLTGHTNSLLFRLNNKNHLVHVRTLQSGQVKHTPSPPPHPHPKILSITELIVFWKMNLLVIPIASAKFKSAF